MSIDRTEDNMEYLARFLYTEKCGGRFSIDWTIIYWPVLLESDENMTGELEWTWKQDVYLATCQFVTENTGVTRTQRNCMSKSELSSVQRRRPILMTGGEGWEEGACTR